MSRAPATWATVVALALVNTGVATVIVASMGNTTVAPAWVGVVLLVVGLAAGVAAVQLWRQYLLQVREH